MFCFGAIFCNLVVQITILSPFMVIWFRVNKIKHTVKVKPLHKLTCTVLIYSEIKAHSLHVLLPMNSWIMYDSSIKCMLNCKQCLLFTFSWCAVWVKVHVPNCKFFELLFTSSHTLKVDQSNNRHMILPSLKERHLVLEMTYYMLQNAWTSKIATFSRKEWSLIQQSTDI